MLRETRNNTGIIKLLLVIAISECIGIVIVLKIRFDQVLDRLDIIEGLLTK